MNKMECVFAGGPAADVLPAIGDIGAVPAACRYEAWTQGEQVRHRLADFWSGAERWEST